MKKLVFGIVLFSLFSISCKKKDLNQEKSSTVATYKFIRNFLDRNSIRIYNSEIQRTRVNFFPKTNTLIYHFWKKEKLENNGSFFLHLFPSDKTDLPEKRIKTGFINLPLKKNELINSESRNFIIIKPLQLPYNIDAIVTGQYKGKRKSWTSVFKEKAYLTRAFLSDSSFYLDEKNIFNFLFSENIKEYKRTLPNIGFKIYEDNKKKMFSIYFNSNFNRLLYIFQDIKKSGLDKGNFYLEIQKKHEKKREYKRIDSKEVFIKDNKGVFVQNLNIKEVYKELIIGQKIDSVKKILKKVYIPESIYKSSRQFTWIKNIKTEEDRNIALLENLIFNNIPLVYYNQERDLSLFFNNRTGYLVTHNLDKLDSYNLKLRFFSSIKENSVLKEIKLKNTFSIKTRENQLAIFEIDLPEKIDKIKLYTVKNEESKFVFERSFK
ncbi:hypothetical protein ACFSTE_05655 [Aquimarina hainanensis]|uniref:Lipoprotein n=1 Tax=Aquimarina hainanensis TaxID=1578017 RepID=A0ABW5N520_9FLAO